MKTRTQIIALAILLLCVGFCAWALICSRMSHELHFGRPFRYWSDQAVHASTKSERHFAVLVLTEISCCPACGDSWDALRVLYDLKPTLALKGLFEHLRMDYEIWATFHPDDTLSTKALFAISGIRSPEEFAKLSKSLARESLVMPLGPDDADVVPVLIEVWNRNRDSYELQKRVLRMLELLGPGSRNAMPILRDAVRYKSFRDQVMSILKSFSEDADVKKLLEEIEELKK